MTSHDVPHTTRDVIHASEIPEKEQSMSDKENANSPLRITKRNPGYWRVTFDNPPINLEDSRMIVGVQRLLDQLESDHDLKILVFDSAKWEFFISHHYLLSAGAV